MTVEASRPHRHDVPDLVTDSEAVEPQRTVQSGWVDVSLSSNRCVTKVHVAGHVHEYTLVNVLTSNGYVLDESPHRLGEVRDSSSLARDHEGLWDRLRTDGHLLLRGFLDPSDVWDFRAHYFETLRPTGLLAAGSAAVDGRSGDAPPDPAMLRSLLFQTIVPGREYDAFCTQRRIRSFFSWLLGTPSEGAPIHLHRRKILRHTQPGATGIGAATQAHYDLVYLREGTERVLSMWVPLGDCPRERGGLAYLEGSHHGVLRDEALGSLPRPAASITADLPGLADEHDSRWLVADYRAGDVLIHSAHIIHAATDNVDAGGLMRLSTDFRYQRTGEPIDWRWQDHWIDTDGL